MNKNIIHIAGSKGKGTTAHLLAALLQAQVFKVGLFTSPALLNDREMIQVNGEEISEEALENLKEFFKDASLSPFELLTACALKYFEEENCDYTILECGWGGARDATNTVEEKRLTILTHLELEHTEVLGHTLQEIAREKLGICREGVRLLTPESQREFLQPFLEGIDTRFVEAKVGGRHHPESVGLALAAMEELGLEADLSSLEELQIPGRMERVDYFGHTLILDGAHTLDSVDYVKKQVNAQHFAIHFLSDKHPDLWKQFPSESTTWIVLEDERAGTAPADLESKSVEDFLLELRQESQKQLVLWVGSFKLVAALKRFLHANS